MTETEALEQATGEFPPESTNALIGQFEAAMFSGGSYEEVIARIFDRPALLWPERWPELEQFAHRQPDDRRKGVVAAIDLLRELESNVSAKPGGWYSGGGPLEALATRVSGGLLSEAEARLAAVADDMVWRMSPEYVRRSADRSSYIAQGGDWQQGAVFGRLTLAAADAYPLPAFRRQMQGDAIGAWMTTVTLACIAVPDGALFSDAKTRGLELLARQQESGDDAGRARTLFQLGVLHLDPYQAGRDPQNIRTELRWWEQRFVNLYGQAALADKSRQMPEALEAMGDASNFLEQAADLQRGVDRGRSLKARSDSMALTELLGGPANRPALKQCVEEALSLLPEDQFPAQVQTLRSYAKHFALAIASAPPAARDSGALETADPASLIADIGYIAVVERFDAASVGLASSDPDRAIRLLLRLWPHLGEAEKVRIARRVLEMLAHKGSADNLLGRHGGSYGKAAAEAEGLPVERRLAALVQLAFQAIESNREEEVLSFARSAVELAAMDGAALAEVLKFLHSWLLIGAAVNGANAERWAGTTKYYCEALETLTAIRAFDSASNILAASADAAVHEGDQGSTELTVALASIGPLLARADLPRLGDEIHQAWLRLFAWELRSGRTNPVRHNLQVQAAKGATFAVMLHHASAYEARRDGEAMGLLQQRSAIRGSEALSDIMLNEFVLISHHAQAAPEGPSGAVERLAQKFDAHVVSRLTDGEDALHSYLLEPEWSERLDPADLVIDQLLVRDEDDAGAVITGVHSTDGRKLTVGSGGLPLKFLQMELHGRKLEANVFGLSVAELREALQEEPAPALATDRALEELDSVAMLFAGAMPILREERAKGRTHLCFIPHGPFHFCPMHLIPDEGRILAEDWTVTYLPHPALLRRRRSALSPDRAGAASFGMSFANKEHGFEPLPEALAEAAKVAELMGGSAWTDADATEERLLESLAGCRYVHVATHGRQNIFGPMLQQLFLTPSAGSDGIFHAYEVLGLDLRHMDLVTLSACETALGRFDVNDNLRGLVATLLIAGAPSVISTLWPVGDCVSRAFFESLYAHIAAGSAKLDAFRAAQLETRASFPAYRDWGAFIYTGAW